MRTKTQDVYLQTFIEDYDKKNSTNNCDLIEFDPDEFVTVRPIGSLPRTLTEAIYDLYDIPEPWSKEVGIEQKRLRRERDKLSIVAWSVKDEAGERFPLPSEQEDVWETMPPNLENILALAVLHAFQRKEDKLDRVGEENASSERSRGEATIGV